MGFSLKSIVDPGGHFTGKGKTLNLRTLIDPGDLMGGQAASEELNAATRAQQQAQRDAIAQQENMYRMQMAMGEGYRQIGYGALPQLRESLGQESQLGQFRSKAAQQFMAQRLGNLGFGARASESLGQRGVASAQAGEERARQGRIRDVVALGSGQTAQGMGMAGRQGAGMAQTYLQGARQQGELMAEKSQARQAQMAGITQGIGRYYTDRIGQEAADKARGSYYGGY